MSVEIFTENVFDVDLHLCGHMWNLVVIQFLFHKSPGWFVTCGSRCICFGSLYRWTGIPIALVDLGLDLYMLVQFTGQRKK